MPIITPDETSKDAPYAVLVGSVLPTLVASPFGAAFGNAIQFDGVTRGFYNTQGVECGTKALTVRGAYTLEAKVRTGTLPAQVGDLSGIIAGKWNNVTSASQYLLYLDGNSRKFAAVQVFANGTTAATAIGYTVAASNTNYDVAMDWADGVLRLYVNGVMEASVAIANINLTPSCRFLIGRDDDPGAAPAPYPFVGSIDSVRLSKVARYVPTNQVSNPSFERDASGWGGNGNISPTGGIDGSKCAEFPAGPYDYFIQEPGFAPNTTYTVSWYMRAAVGTTTTSAGIVTEELAAGWTGTNQIHVNNPPSTWTRYSFTFTTGSTGGGKINLHNNYGGSSSGGSVFIDDVQVERSATATTFTTAGYTPAVVPFVPDAGTQGLWFLNSLAGRRTPAEVGGMTNNGVLIGGPLGVARPSLITSPFAGFGNALSFDGVVRGAAYAQGVDCGTTAGLTIQGVGAAATFCLEAKVRTGATVGERNIAGHQGSGGSAGAVQPSIRTSATSKAQVSVRTTAGAQVDLSGTTTLAADTNYTVAATYDGTTMRIFLNGALEGSLAIPGVESPDTTTPFYIGRNADGGSRWLGSIEEVRLSSVARYTAAYTPAASPFTTDADTLGLWHLDTTSGRATNPRVFRSSPASGLIRDLLTTFGPAQNINTILGWPTGNVATVGRFTPMGSAAAGNASPPVSGAAATGVGWRDSIAENAAEKITYEPGVWTLRIKTVKTDEAVQIAHDGLITAIVYRVTTGGISTEIGRSSVGAHHLSAGGHDPVSTQSFTTVTPTVLAVGEKIQVEVYYTHYALGTTTPTAPAASLNFRLIVDTTDASFSSAFIEIPDYTIQYGRTATSTAVGTSSSSRRNTGFRSSTVNAMGTAISARSVAQNRFSSVTAFGSAASSRIVSRLKTSTSTAIGSATSSRLITALRSASATTIGTATSSRLITALRATSVNAVGTSTSSRTLSHLRSSVVVALGTSVTSRTITAARSSVVTALGEATSNRLVVRLRSSIVTAVAAADSNRLVTAFRSSVVTALGTATSLRSIIYGRLSSVTAFGTAKMRVEFGQNVLNRMINGGGSVVTKWRNKFIPFGGD